MTANLDSPPSQPNDEYASPAVVPTQLTLLRALQTTWVATGLCMLGLTFAVNAYFESSFARLLTSDDSYALASAASVPVAGFFGIGTLAGWWFRSALIERVATVVPLLCFAGLLIVADHVHDFGEGDQIVGILGRDNQPLERRLFHIPKGRGPRTMAIDLNPK